MILCLFGTKQFVVGLVIFKQRFRNSTLLGKIMGTHATLNIACASLLNEFGMKLLLNCYQDVELKATLHCLTLDATSVSTQQW